MMVGAATHATPGIFRAATSHGDKGYIPTAHGPVSYYCLYALILMVYGICAGYTCIPNSPGFMGCYRVLGDAG
jgi:hypothetical protein